MHYVFMQINNGSSVTDPPFVLKIIQALGRLVPT